MFTGIIKYLGKVKEVKMNPTGARLKVAVAASAGYKIGESVSTNGVCLTVVARDKAGIAFDLSRETLKRTTLGGLKPGSKVNLERALRAGDALGGHFVSGHVDGVGRVAAIHKVGEGSEIVFSAPPALLPYIAEKGSVGVEGVSLTTYEVRGRQFKVAFIPHTLAQTNLGEKRVGDPVNLEIDLLARYLHRLLVSGKVPAAFRKAEGAGRG